jgi:hypothetical protein
MTTHLPIIQYAVSGKQRDWHIMVDNKAIVNLQIEQPFIIYQVSLVRGYLKVYFGYRLSEGTVVVNAQPLEMTIN